MGQNPEQMNIERFFNDLSDLFGRLGLHPCDIWVAGSYARGEQKAKLVVISLLFRLFHVSENHFLVNIRSLSICLGHSAKIDFF